jgi:hypothetical protein
MFIIANRFSLVILPIQLHSEFAFVSSQNSILTAELLLTQKSSFRVLPNTSQNPRSKGRFAFVEWFAFVDTASYTYSCAGSSAHFNGSGANSADNVHLATCKLNAASLGRLSDYSFIRHHSAVPRIPSRRHLWTVHRPTSIASWQRGSATFKIFAAAYGRRLTALRRLSSVMCQWDPFRHLRVLVHSHVHHG